MLVKINIMRGMLCTGLKNLYVTLARGQTSRFLLGWIHSIKEMLSAKFPSGGVSKSTVSSWSNIMYHFTLFRFIKTMDSRVTYLDRKSILSAPEQ